MTISFTLRAFHQSTEEIQRELGSLAGLPKDLSTITNRVQNIHTTSQVLSSGVSELQNSLKTLEWVHHDSLQLSATNGLIRQRSLSSGIDLQSVVSTVGNLERMIEGRSSNAARQRNLNSVSHPGLGTATAQVHQGSLLMDANLRATRTIDLDGALHNLFDGVLENFKQELIHTSRREIRGWVAESVRETFSQTTESMTLELSNLFSEREKRLDHCLPLLAPGHVCASGRQTKVYEDDEKEESTQVRKDSYKLKDFTGLQTSSTSHDTDVEFERSVTVRNTVLGSFMLRIIRGLRWQKVKFIFQPARFISRGIETGYEFQLDGRGLPMIRGGELQIYAIIDNEDPIYELIWNNDVDALRAAFQNKTICISDRSARRSDTFLHVSKWRQNVILLG